VSETALSIQGDQKITIEVGNVTDSSITITNDNCFDLVAQNFAYNAIAEVVQNTTVQQSASALSQTQSQANSGVVSGFSGLIINLLITGVVIGILWYLYKKYMGKPKNEKQKKTLIINGIIDDIDINCLSNHYIDKRIFELKQISNSYVDQERYIFNRIIESTTFKDILIYGNEDYQKKIISVFTEINLIKQSKIDIIVKRFLELDNYYKRNMLINLLLYNNNDEILYICYLLYDLITANSIDTNETNDHIFIYDSLPWKLKEHFKDVVKYAVKYTNDMIQKYDVNKISLEQQIYLLKANDNVKDKALTKLKEIKGKPDESGLKAKHYLEGLVKIPFGVYREEPILKKIKSINATFIKLYPLINYFFPTLYPNKKEKYTVIEMLDFIKTSDKYMRENVLKIIEKNLFELSNREILSIIQYINLFKKANKKAKLTINKIKNS
jgi:hypothetical protein